MALSRRTLVATHRVERSELLATLERVGSDAPTLCDDWTSTQIASHLVASEAQAGLWWAAGWPACRLLGPARTASLLERAQPAFDAAMRRLEGEGWARLLERLQAGPPRLFGAATLTRVRLLEDWIHHEDVRRAGGAEPRPLDEVRRAALIEGMELLTTMPEFAEGRERIGAVLEDGTTLSGGPEPEVTLRGDPGEILLAVAGRGSAARIMVEGDASLIAPAVTAF